MKINIEEIKEFLGCDEPFLAQLMETFVQESGAGMNRLKSAAQDKNWPMVRATAHKLLSSTRIFNIGELSDTLEVIEKTAAEGTDTESIPARVNAVEQSWKVVIDEIKVLLPKLKS